MLNGCCHVRQPGDLDGEDHYTDGAWVAAEPAKKARLGSNVVTAVPAAASDEARVTRR